MDLNEDLLKRFTVKSQSIPSLPGCWNVLKVEVFDKDQKIGEFNRDYHCIFDTFHPFEIEGRFFALYSPHYTCTRIMSLPGCKDLGGEEPHAHGFCPTGYAVPMVTVQKNYPDENDPKPENPRHMPKKWARIEKKDNTIYYNWPKEGDANYPDWQEACQIHDRLHDEWMKRHEYHTIPAKFGFVAGCHWGDDSSWKIQYLDLSQAAQGILTRTDRFGYIELPGELELKDAIELDSYAPDYPYVKIAVPQRFDLRQHVGDIEREISKKKMESPLAYLKMLFVRGYFENNSKLLEEARQVISEAELNQNKEEEV